MSLESNIESVLFFRGEPVSVKKLAEILEVDVEKIEEGLLLLEKSLTGRGIVLVRDAGEVILETAPEASEIIQKITKDELSGEIGRAGLETLSLVLYHGPISRREIDYVRGVNSAFILRNLLVRGLVEKTDAKEGERSFTYKPTLELLSHLGVTKIEEFPEYEQVKNELREFNERLTENKDE
jgi:segregation and condensation protein B